MNKDINPNKNQSQIPTPKAKRQKRKRAITIPLIPLGRSEAEQGEYGRTNVIELHPDRISIDQLRTIWNDKEVTYTDSELHRIRDWLYSIAEATIGVYEKFKSSGIRLPIGIKNTKRNRKGNQEGEEEKQQQHQEQKQQQPSTQQINPTSHHTPSNEAEKSHPLCPRIHRRAS